MADRELEIQINTLAKTHGLEEVEDALKRVKHSTGEASEATEKHGHSFLHAESSGRAFHKVMHEITSQSPLMGVALRAALAPTTGLLFAVVVAMERFREAQKQAAEEAKKLGEEAGAAYISAQEEARKLGEEAAKATSKFASEFLALAEAQDTADKKTGKVTEDIKAQEAAVTSLLKAQEAYAISQATTEGQRADIRVRYAGKEREVKDAAAKAEMEAREKELAFAEKQAPVLRARVEAEEARGDEARSRAADIKAKEAELKPYEESLKKPLPLPQERMIAQQETARINAEIARQRKADEDQKAALEEARKAELKNQEIIERGRADLPGFRARTELDISARRAAGAYGAATGPTPDFGTQIIGALGRADIAGMTAAVAALTQWTVKMAQLSKAIADADKALDRAIKDVDAHAKSVANP